MVRLQRTLRKENRNSFMMVNFFWAAIVAATSLYEGHTYYVSVEGNDANDGRSSASAWKTLAKINQTKFEDGDKILLKGGNVFTGFISIEGKGLQNLTIASYGKKKATINAGKGSGIYVSNVPALTIENLLIKGNGVIDNKGSGIFLYTNTASEKIKNIRIENCTVKGFQGYGILLRADGSAQSGFEDVEIKNCIAEENGEAGIGSLAVYPAISHNNIRVVNCKAFNNRGITSKTDNHSGNGIVLSGVNGFDIDHCEAYENGADCRSVSGGPVGIWVWNATNGIIQHSISHNNHAGTSLHDGGGFDLDGGVSNSAIKNCKSYSNEGAGYLICEFGSGNSYTNNIVEHNTSINDGLKNSYGAITIAGAGKSDPVMNTIVQYNHITVQAKNLINGTPSALYFSGTDYKNIVIRYNKFIIEKGTDAIRTDTVFTNEMAKITNNRFKNKASADRINCSSCIEMSLAEWKQKLLEANKVSNN